MPDYRVIVLYKAANDAEALKSADKLATAVPGAKIDRVTTKRETWGTVAEEE